MINVKCYSWNGKSVDMGIAMISDPKLGQVIFLGEDGRGRRYEKVALGKRNPAEVVSGRVMNAVPQKITLPARDGKPEKTFYVLERPRSGNGHQALVRVSTQWCYTKNSAGRWETVAGKPETIVSGYGAHGIAGRIGNWDDGLIVMSVGDVLKIKPEGGYKTEAFALWIDENGTPQTASWQDYENLQAVSKAEALIAEAETAPQALNLAFGRMPCSTYVGRGEFRPGIEIGKGATGPAIMLGEKGRGRKLVEIPFVGMEPPKLPCPSRGEKSGWYSSAEPSEHDKKCPKCGVQRDKAGQGYETQLVHPTDRGDVLDLLQLVAVAKLSEEVTPPRYSYDQPTVKVIYGLTSGNRDEVGGTHLVRIIPTRSPHRSYLRVEKLRGEPKELARGNFASGDAGAAGSSDDALYVFRPGDVVKIGESRVVENVGGEIRSALFNDWEAADGQTNPEAYIAQGKAPFGRVPSEWIGRIVSVIRREVDTYRGETTVNWPEGDKGELVSLSPLVLNTGWDGRDRKLMTVSSGVWVKLHADLQAKTLQGDEAREREEAKAEMMRLRAEAKELQSSSYFTCLEDGLRKRVGQAADGREFSSWSEGDALDITLASTDDIRRWNESAKAVMAEAGEASVAAKELSVRQASGEILIDFVAWHRRGGASGCGDGWVIQSDGSLRTADSNDVPRHKSDGNFRWNRVQPDELALRWSCGSTHDVGGTSTFEVTKKPTNGLSAAQRETVRRIEEEIGAPEGAFGLDPELAARRAARIEGLRNALGRVRCLKKVPDQFDPAPAFGTTGMMINPEDVRGNSASYANDRLPFSERCDGRDAQVVETVPAADGMCDVLAYHKYGQWNLAIRWRERHENEVVQAAPPADAKPASNHEVNASLAALKAKFGKR